MKKPTSEATIRATPVNASTRGPPKIPIKNAITPAAHNSEAASPAVLAIPFVLAMIQRYQIPRYATIQGERMAPRTNNALRAYDRFSGSNR